MHSIEIVNYTIPSSVIDTALSYKNVIEVGNNRGVLVDRFNNISGASLGSPWCQSYVYSSMSANGLVAFRTAHANTYYNNFRRKYGAIDGKVSNRFGIITWKYPSSSNGHTGFILKVVSSNYVQTIEGNTSCDNSSPDGRLYAGKQGVFVKLRRLGKLGSMELRGVIQ